MENFTTHKQEIASQIADGIVQQVHELNLNEEWLEVADGIELGYIELETLHYLVNPFEQALIKKAYRRIGLHFFFVKKEDQYYECLL